MNRAQSLALIPSNESWTETVLYSFTGRSDGAYPLAGGPAGHLYGTTFGGGYGQGLQGDGVVFEIVRNFQFHSTSSWPLRDQRPVAGDQGQQPPIT
jgi:hypothetical protein